MLVRVDLGLPYLVVLVAVVVVFPAIGFVIRRKWRRAVARREDIRKLLVLASEEAARAEVEASEGYYYTAAATVSAPFPVSASVPAPVTVPLVSSVKRQYQCAVCFSPTTTRCANCKAVRYCSGRCQIVHWRQGHKDECRPYVAVDPVHDASVTGSSYKQVDSKDCNEGSNTEGRPTATPVERLPEDLYHKDKESHAHRQETKSTFQSTEYSAISIPRKSPGEVCSDSKTEPDGVDIRHFAAHVTSEKSEKLRSERQTLVSPARKSAGLGKVHHRKASLSDEGTRSRLSSSSSRTDDGSNESSFSEPSTTLSGFWSGTSHSKKSSIHELNDFEPSSPNVATSGNMSDSRLPSNFSFDATKSGSSSTVANGFTATSTVDKPGPIGSRGKKSTDETTLSKEMSNAGFSSSRSPKCTSEISKRRDVDAGTESPVSFKETKVSPSGAVFHHASAAGGNSALKDAKAFSGIPSASPDRLNHVVKKKNVDSPTLKSVGVGSSLSKPSETHLTSSASRHSQSAKHVKSNDENHKVATSSSQSTENAESDRNGLKTSMLKVIDQFRPSKSSHHGSLAGESETSHRYNGKGLFSYETFVKLYNWKKVELQPCGLINCGNSCYANAVLQCLAYTPPLTAYLLQGLHSKSCNKREWCFTCEFEALVRKAKDGNSPLSPIRILSQIKNIGSNLGHGSQEDAHEFLRYAIDTLQSACLEEAGTHASNSLEEETTLIGLTFGGYLRSKIQCMKCGGKSERHERMMDLTVEIYGDIGTLEEALNKFTCTEILDGENKYKCSRCKSYEKAKKKLTLLEAPNVLTIALKRFQSGKFGKLNKPIRFPEILDMAPYVSGTSDKSPVYRLYGVVVHLDVMNAAFSGHYVCYVKNVQNRWFKIDDSSVKEVDLHNVLTKGAYMLLYARCSPRAPRPIRSSLMHHHHDPRKHKPPTPFAAEPWGVRRSLEDESSSSSSSDNSGFFSESCSCSTDSSGRRDSSGIEDHIFGDWERDCWNVNPNSSDSDTSSSSSFPSPLSRGGRGAEILSGPRVLYCRSSSSSCREPNFDRLGGRPIDPPRGSKLGVTFRTARGRSD